MWPQSFYFIFVTAIVTTWAAFVRKVKHWQNCDRGYNLKPCAQLCKTKIQDITPWSWNSFRNWTLSTGGSPTSWQISASSKHVLKIARNKRRKQDWKSHGKQTYTDGNSEGFNIAAQPAAKAGATFHVAINRGWWLTNGCNAMQSND